MSVAMGAVADQRPEFRVAVFGLAARLQKILEIVLKHARHNQYRYTVAESKGPGHYDIALVDMTVKGGPVVARTLRRLAGNRPVVTVGRRTDPIRRDDVVHSTFTMQVLRALNGVVDHQLLGLLPQADATTRARDAAGGSTTRDSVAARTYGEAAPADAIPRSSLPQPGDSAAAATGPAWSGTTGQRGGGLVVEPPVRPRLLIVDDSPTVRRQLLEALVPMRLEIDAVANAEEALKSLASRRYDLIFVDVVMPDMDGYKLTRIIKKDKRLRATSVVMLTSRSSPFDLLRGALAGCNSYLVKPVSLASLKETVIRHTRRIAVLDEQTGQLRMA